VGEGVGVGFGVGVGEGLGVGVGVGEGVGVGLDVRDGLTVTSSSAIPLLLEYGSVDVNFRVVIVVSATKVSVNS
jgi:hypothetical protein